MTDARYPELKRMLEVRRRELQRNLGAKRRDLRANNGHDGELVGALDTAEASDSDLQQDIAITVTEMTAEVLGRVDEALARLASGVYGSGCGMQRRGLAQSPDGAPLCAAMSRVWGAARDRRETIAPTLGGA